MNEEELFGKLSADIVSLMDEYEQEDVMMIVDSGLLHKIADSMDQAAQQQGKDEASKVSMMSGNAAMMGE